VPPTTNEGKSCVSSESSSEEVSNEIAGLVLSASNGAQQGTKAFGCCYPRGGTAIYHCSSNKFEISINAERCIIVKSSKIVYL
jgi:hypothetical protein